MGTWHVVKQGEWLSKIAGRYHITNGMIIWNDPHNAGLKEARDPELLFPGDRLYIPDKDQAKTESRGTDKKHAFVVKAPPTDSLHVKVLDADGNPLANRKFRLTAGDQKFRSTTTGDGEVIVEGIKAQGEHEGVLDFYEIDLAFPIAVGNLNPAHQKKAADPAHYDDGISGLQMRLANLGFDPGPSDGTLGPQTRDAIQRFQNMVMQRAAEEATGEPDSETRNTIIKEFGC